MAQVRITDKLCSEISDKVNEMQRKEVQDLTSVLAADGTEAALVPEASKLAEMVAWGKFYNTPTHRDTPDAWVCTPSRNIAVKFMVEGKHVFTTSVPPVRIPPNSSLWSPSVDVQLSNLSQPLRERIQQHVSAMEAVKTKYNNIRVGLKSILDAFISLNAAIKHTPALMLYLPQDVRDKLEEKTTRTKKDPADLPVVNAELLATVGVTHALR